MESTSKKSKASRRNDARDRLSELPDEILVHILSFLPILDAVRTVAIRRFGYLWTLVSSLSFKIDSDEYIPHFARNVRNVLMLHKGFPVEKFVLHFYNPNMGYDDQEIIDTELWIRFAIGRQVKILNLQFDNVDYDVSTYIVPRFVFTSQFLVKLKLFNCEIERVTRVQMGSLRKLSLECVKVSNEMFKKVISGCPCLQELALKYALDLDEVRFTNPNIVKLDIVSFIIRVLDCPYLKILNIHQYWSRQHVQVVNISSVREVHINSYTKINEIVIKICKAEVVELLHGAFWGLNFKELNIPQTRWKSLHIKSSLNEDRFIGICRLLRSSPHLEELIVFSTSRQNLRRKSGKTHDYHMLSEELSSPLVIPHLKTATMHFYEVPCQGLLQLAEFLLKSCVNLENMVILSSTCDPVEENKILKQLCRIPSLSKCKGYMAEPFYVADQIEIVVKLSPRFRILGSKF